jgi:hypothetical protein
MDAKPMQLRYTADLTAVTEHVKYYLVPTTTKLDITAGLITAEF